MDSNRPWRKMAMLEDANTMRGLDIDDASPAVRVRSARRMAVVALAAALLWGFGILSVIGAVAGAGSWAFLRSNDTDSGYRWVALAATAIGVTGLLATTVVVGPAAVDGL